MKTRVKQHFDILYMNYTPDNHIYVVVFWLMAKYLFSLLVSSDCEPIPCRCITQLIAMDGWHTFFKVIAHMFNVVCFSFIHLANNYSLQVCGVTKIRARRKCWRKPPNQKETRDWQIFNCSPNAKQLQLSPWEEEEEHFYIAGRRRFVMKRESPFARKWRYNNNRKTLVFACDGGFTSVILAR
jgi:hypothetical protein